MMAVDIEQSIGVGSPRVGNTTIIQDNKEIGKGDNDDGNRRISSFMSSDADRRALLSS